MGEVLDRAARFARSDLAVLISGESGVGKELIAQSVHNESPRRAGPFVAVNCAALTESLLESELFGYEEGSFTAARGKEASSSSRTAAPSSWTRSGRSLPRCRRGC